LEAELEELRDQVKVLQQRITELQSALDERP
jgi:prefoldin subunit 5